MPTSQCHHLHLTLVSPDAADNLKREFSAFCRDAHQRTWPTFCQTYLPHATVNENVVCDLTVYLRHSPILTSAFSRRSTVAVQISLSRHILCNKRYRSTTSLSVASRTSLTASTPGNQATSSHSRLNARSGPRLDVYVRISLPLPIHRSNRSSCVLFSSSVVLRGTGMRGGMSIHGGMSRRMLFHENK